MRRTTCLAVAALVAGCSSTPSSVWLHPEKGDTGEKPDLEACERQAEDVFSEAETDALGHGDFGTYGELVDQRRAMVEKCMAERGWAKVKLPEPSEPPAPVEDAPPEATRLGVEAPPEAQAPAPAPATPAAAPAAAAPVPAPVPPPQPPATAAAPRGVAQPAAADPPGPVPPAAPPETAAAPRGAPAAPPSAATPSPASAAPAAPATAPVEPATTRTPEARRQADLLACRAEAERALAESGGDALAHGDFSEFTPTAERRKKRVEKCMAERGWASADGG